MDSRTKARIFASLYLHTFLLMLFVWCGYLAYISYVESYNQRCRARCKRRYNMKAKLVEQIKHIRNIIAVSDVNCVNNLRMDRNAFAQLCYLLKTVGGLRDSKHVRVCEQVAITISVLSHHKKNRIVGFDFLHSGDTINHYFHRTLDALIKLNKILYAKPRPIGKDCDNDNWKPFKGCVGALDGTHILIQVPLKDQNRFRSHKGPTSVNVLAVSHMHMQFIYVMSGWEGSASDSRVLRDAVTRPTGLKVAAGTYYLADCGYMNAEGFLTPYRERRYHLDEWGEENITPQDPQEYFNLKHAKARNIIERAFQRLKGRWAILRSKSFYPLKTFNKIVICCALLHNFIRNEMEIDPMDAFPEEEPELENNGDEPDPQFVIASVEASSLWSRWRDELAQQMFDSWSGSRLNRA